MGMRQLFQKRRGRGLADLAPPLIALSLISASAMAGGPPNDECSSPMALVGDTLVIPFDNSTASTGAEGQEPTPCDGAGIIGIEHDLWYCWTSPVTGTVTIETCGFTNIDTKIAMYDGCDCPTGNTPLLCCDDDFCAPQSRMTCDVICGKQYLIQLGNKPGTPPGTGNLSLRAIGDPCNEPCCIDFNDGTTNGFGPCPTAPQITVTTATPGPSGNASDFYLRLRDLSGSSLACGAACIGDWVAMADGPCGAFCFDFRLFEDGCVPSIPECAANGGWIPIAPRVIISNGTVRAVFVASFTVTDANGPNPGWVSVCAPIGLLDSSGNLPNNDDGAWVMVGGAPNSDWNSLITNVTEIQLPIDFTGNPAEIAGYDNLCIRTDVCPCMEIVEEDIRCELGADGQPTGNYNLTFNITNYSGVTAYYALFPGQTPHVVPLIPPLPGDGSATATISMVVTNAVPGDTFCFDVILADETIEECCSSNLCVELPDCDCMLFANEEVLCAPGGGFTLNFDITNLTPDVVEHMFLIPQPIGTSVTITPDYVDVPSMNPFTTQSFGPFTIANANAGDVICIRVSIHNEDLGECCSQDLCFTVPDCPRFSPCDLNEDGTVDVFDLFALLSNWGPCPPSPCNGDTNGDNQINVFDLFDMLASWG